LLGSYLCESKLNKARFRVGTGLTDIQRKNPLKKGTIITYQYFEVHSSGVPRFPSFVRERLPE